MGLQELRDRAFELSQLPVNLDHLIGGHGVGRVDVRVMLGPLGSALAAVEQEPVGPGAVGVDGGVLQAPATGAFALVRFQLRPLH